MKSPITGKEMKLIREERSLEFRKLNFKVVYHFYQCQDSGEQFTTTKLDELNLNQVYHQYRVKFGVPFPEEITRIREQYGVSASKMAEILGLGINSYRNYESGEMPSLSNAKLIHLADEPTNFLDMVHSCDSLKPTEKSKLSKRIESIISKREESESEVDLKKYLLGTANADIYTGFRSPNMEKLTEMVVYFAEKVQPDKTKLNKLLFYADFVMFQESCQSISGVRYRAIEMGPVPNNFSSIYEYLSNNGDVRINFKEFENGYMGEQFFKADDREFKSELFSDSELKVLSEVVSRFSDKSTSETIEISHKEEAWIKNHSERKLISYEHAFEFS